MNPSDFIGENSAGKNPNLPPNLSDLVNAMQVIEDARKPAAGAYFVAVVKKELDVLDLDLDPDIAEVGNPLIELDTTATEKTSLHFDQSLGLLSYREALEAAGLQLGVDSFSPSLDIVDGERFAETLATIPSGHDVLRVGVEKIIANALMEIADVQEMTIPNDQISDIGGEAAYNYSRSVLAHTLINAPAILDDLRRLGAEEHLITELEQASIADSEGMLSHWSAAYRLGLYRPATDNVFDYDWTQLDTAEEWASVDQLLGTALKQAPQGSLFMHNLTTIMLSNIEKMQNNQFEPSRSPYTKANEESDDYPDDFFDDFVPGGSEPSGHTVATNPVLNDVVLRLRRIQAWL